MNVYNHNPRRISKKMDLYFSAKKKFTCAKSMLGLYCIKRPRCHCDRDLTATNSPSS
jgi:hypothetical protein